jgi:hypothetical protein
MPPVLPHPLEIFLALLFKQGKADQSIDLKEIYMHYPRDTASGMNQNWPKPVEALTPDLLSTSLLP